MNPDLAVLIAEGIVEAIKLADGKPLAKEDILDIVKQSMRAASEAKMEKEFPGQAP